ncbi:ABC transporter substrate-binding protein [Desulfotalea psychrophila]|uniref:Probable Fe(III) ABC transporter, periplasmic substrate-binding protein n=1 Tax=Desulfotalea psychrophila (strain LSv54 / DSM 12343) TaxID=177439 RepID=Q6ARS9_DESPS|nr:ABC transporter substrate-binding protein [Desulfotalea psychrophila]CAG34946.1 probable Fe(III) ABC transporter, periplasmic substrate-binding protein [Desulfotalea psychrophila LSv54]
MKNKFSILLLCTLFTATALQASVNEARPDPIYKRIISLYPAHTENLVSMGATESIIGISRSDTYPAAILDRPRFSYREDPEKFIAAKPDLVLIRPMIARAYPLFVQKLEEAGIRVISLQPQSVDELYSYWQDLGKLAGKQAQAGAMLNLFQERLRLFKEQLALIPQKERPRVYFESIHRRMKTFAPGSIALFAMKEAGGINIACDAAQVRSTNIADYGKEHILAKAGQIDVYLAQQGRMNPVERATITAEPAFAAIKAVQNDRVYLIKEEIISRPTMRILLGIAEIHRLLYPQENVNAQ